MKKNHILKVYSFSHPLMFTEMFSLAGDKFRDSLPFHWELTNDYSSSDVVIWDGVVTMKNAETVKRVIEDVKIGKVLLLLGESQTLFKNNPLVEIKNTENLNCVELFGWNILPEEILMALESCYKKLKHV